MGLGVVSTKYEVTRGRVRKEVALTGIALRTPYAQGAVADIRQPTFGGAKACQSM